MGERPDSKICDTFQDSGDRIAVRHHGSYGTTAILPSDFNDNLGCIMSAMDALYHEVYSLREDEFQKQKEIPWQNVINSGPEIHYDGTERKQPPISTKFNDLSKKKKDSTIHARIDNLQWATHPGYVYDQQINSGLESREYAGGQMVRPECIQQLGPTLGPLLRVGSFEGSAWTKKWPKTACHLVNPDSVYKESDEIEASMCKVQTCDENDDTNGFGRKNHLMVVDTIINLNRKSVANSFGQEIEDQNQINDIDYVKELKDYIEEISDYGFDHIIVIGERYIGLLFMDCFGRVFDLDDIGCLWLRGDYFKLVERNAKGLTIDREAYWTFAEDEGIVVEVKSNTSYDHYNYPVEKTKKEAKEKKHKKETSLIWMRVF